MYFNKEKLERMRQEAEEQLKRWEEEKKGKKYESAAGKPILCLHCGEERFDKGKALMNTRGLTFFDLEWLDGSAITLICKRCGFVHWFEKDVKEIADES